MTITHDSPPAALPVRPEVIPQELRDETRWVAWRWEWREGPTGGKWTKPPVDAHTGRCAKSTDPATWAPFDVALAHMRANRLPGVGYNLDGSGLTGVDLDHCRDRESGEIEDWAREIVTALPAYWELSPVLVCPSPKFCGSTPAPAGVAGRLFRRKLCSGPRAIRIVGGGLVD